MLQWEVGNFQESGSIAKGGVVFKLSVDVEIRDYGKPAVGPWCC